MNKVKTAYSTKTDIAHIAEDLKNQIGSFDTRLLQFFASSVIDQQALSTQIKDTFSDVPAIIGCSSFSEITTGKMLTHSVVVMAFGPDIVEDCKVELLASISSDEQVVEKAFDSFKNYYGKDMNTLDPHKYVGMILIDGLSTKEDRINERIGDLTNITFVGGSAGDQMEFKQTFVHANGQTYSDAAVLALIKCKGKFDILKTQSFETTGKTVVATKADEAARIIHEFNGKPAAQEYADLLDIEQKDQIQPHFMIHPVGLVFGDDFFVRSPLNHLDTGIGFLCSIKEGMTMDILESRDIVEGTKKDLEAKIDTMHSVSAIINFNCVLRALELNAKGQNEAYGNLFKDIPTVGFNTYGESYIGHINQTAVMLLFE